MNDFVFVICNNYWYFIGKQCAGPEGFLTIKSYWDLRNYEGGGIPGLVSGQTKAKLLIKHADPEEKITIPMTSIIAIVDCKDPLDMGYS